MKRSLLFSLLPLFCGLGHADVLMVGHIDEWNAPLEPAAPYEMHASPLIYTPQGGAGGVFMEPVVEEMAPPPPVPTASEGPSIGETATIYIGPVVPYATFANGRYYWTYRHRRLARPAHRDHTASHTPPHQAKKKVRTFKEVLAVAPGR